MSLNEAAVIFNQTNRNRGDVVNVGIPAVTHSPFNLRPNFPMSGHGLKCYAFDVDHTLEISYGPVTLQMLKNLREEGHIVGICGNMNVICAVPGWHKFISFLGQSFLDKPTFLHGLRLNIRADDYIMVGGRLGRVNMLGVVTASDDEGSARVAGWRFILEDDFARGMR